MACVDIPLAAIDTRMHVKRVFVKTLMQWSEAIADAFEKYHAFVQSYPDVGGGYLTIQVGREVWTIEQFLDNMNDLTAFRECIFEDLASAMDRRSLWDGPIQGVQDAFQNVPFTINIMCGFESPDLWYRWDHAITRTDSKRVQGPMPQYMSYEDDHPWIQGHVHAGADKALAIFAPLTKLLRKGASV